MEQYIIPAVAAIIVAVIEAIAAHERRQSKEEKEHAVHREQRREEEMRLSMRMMSATLQLSVVTANALTGGHNNGNVERAKDAAEKAETDYQAFLQRTSAHALES